MTATATQIESHRDLLRQELWTSIVRQFCINKSSDIATTDAINAANKILAAFDEKFPSSTETAKD